MKKSKVIDGMNWQQTEDPFWDEKKKQQQLTSENEKKGSH